MLWSALYRTAKGWDERVTVAEAAKLGFASDKYRESVGGGWAWFYSEDDARRASPEGRAYPIPGYDGEGSR